MVYNRETWLIEQEGAIELCNEGQDNPNIKGFIFTKMVILIITSSSGNVLCHLPISKSIQIFLSTGNKLTVKFKCLNIF